VAVTKRGLTIAALVTAAVAFAAGCGGDASSMIAGNAELREKVMNVIGGNGALAAQMVDKLLGADSTRAMVTDKLFANGDAAQTILVRVARNQTMVDGVLNLAVQDTAMKTHVMTLLKGMEMGAATASH
jgi:hypothetical protein